MVPARANEVPPVTCPVVIGLTGGIGSGKSAAADAFASLGAAIVDTDAIAHTLTAPQGAVMAALAAAFGPVVIAPDGALDRGAMRALAFADPAARARLEAIMHPAIRAESARRVSTAQASPGVPYVILAVPLLVESGAYTRGSGRVDRVCVVDCAEETRILRVMQRSALSREQVLAVMAAQATRAQRLSVADDIIDNGGEITALHAQVAQLDAVYRRISGGKPVNAGN